MADDFGDYTGEKLFDWMLRVGQEAGGEAAMAAADRFRNALANARGAAVGESGTPSAAREQERAEGASGAGWAKLDMREFTRIEQWPTLQELMVAKFRDCGIRHDWYRDAEGRDWLLFRATDAPVLVRALDELSADAAQAKDRARAELSRDFERAREMARDAAGRDGRGGPAEERRGKPAEKGPDAHMRTGAEEPLAEKARRARAGAEELNRGERPAPERARRMERDKVQGR